MHNCKETEQKFVSAVSLLESGEECCIEVISQSTNQSNQSVRYWSEMVLALIFVLDLQLDDTKVFTPSQNKPLGESDLTPALNDTTNSIGQR